MGVAFVRKELKEKLPAYIKIKDCIDGESAVKKKTTIYLPKPNPEDTSDENEARYDSYVERAVFYNVAARTSSGLVGQIFSKNPVAELPNLLNSLQIDVNGEGLTLEQSAKETTALVVNYGRGGLFTDYPVTEKGVTLKDIEKGDIRPTISVYKPTEIINWRLRPRGAKNVLSLVVLVETYIKNDDGFEIEEGIQYRVLQLGPSGSNNFENIVDDENVYTVEVWRDTSNGSSIFESYQPKDYTGSFLNEIPFTFVGSENNDTKVDNPPMYDISILNIAHYRNSADYEESSFMVGQPTPYFSGLTQDWVERVMKGVVHLGSRASVLLPDGGGAGLLQAASNTMPFEAMEHKERQMVSLGAKLVEQNTVQRTATEAGIESANENSVLASIANNVSAAYVFALEKASLFVGSGDKIEFSLNTDFIFANLSLNELMTVISMWQSDGLTFSEMRDNLRRGGVASLADEEAAIKLEKQKAEKIEAKGKEAEAINKNNFNND